MKTFTLLENVFVNEIMSLLDLAGLVGDSWNPLGIGSGYE